jgi:aminoglycoside/choline kinase family phosphotransferase
VRDKASDPGPWTKPGPLPEPRDRIARYLRETGLDADDCTAVPLTGDASDRRYFRLIRPGAPPIVLAVHAGPIVFAELPFGNVAGLFQQLPLPIPSVLGYSDSLGIVAQEDLGDLTLQALLREITPSERAAFYRQAIGYLRVLQERGAEIDPAGFLPYHLAFDVEKLTWELEFFVKHFLEGYRGVVLSTVERAVLNEEWAGLARELASEPRVLCHRDYHSRNLMVRDGRLYIIDFQDARMGPDTYDLVSLLRDSYVDLSEGEVDELVAHFLDLTDADRKGRRRTEFRIRFDVMAMQRNLKALGTFGFQATVGKNRSYVEYMPRTLAHVRRNLEKHARFSRLRDVLGRHVTEISSR